MRRRGGDGAIYRYLVRGTRTRTGFFFVIALRGEAMVEKTEMKVLCGANCGVKQCHG